VENQAVGKVGSEGFLALLSGKKNGGMARWPADPPPPCLTPRLLSGHVQVCVGAPALSNFRKLSRSTRQIFQEVIADVLKVKPEPKERKAKGQPKIQKKVIKSKAKRTYGKQGY